MPPSLPCYLFDAHFKDKEDNGPLLTPISLWNAKIWQSSGELTRPFSLSLLYSLKVHVKTWPIQNNPNFTWWFSLFLTAIYNRFFMRIKSQCCVFYCLIFVIIRCLLIFDWCCFRGSKRPEDKFLNTHMFNVDVNKLSCHTELALSFY